MGVIGIISPWNWPHDIPNIAATHGLAAGDSIVMKPASTTPFSALMLAEIYEEAGFPKGAVNIVTGPGGDRRRGARQQPRARRRSTSPERPRPASGSRRSPASSGSCSSWAATDRSSSGTTPTSRRPSRRPSPAASTSPGRSAPRRSASSCTRPSTTSSSRSWWRGRSKVKVGNPLDADTDMGPLNNPSNVAKVQAHFDDARERGGKFLMGGNIDGMYADVTVVDGVTSDFLMARDETFGPVAPIMTFKDMDECLQDRQRDAVRPAGGRVHQQPAHRVPARRGHRVRHGPHQRDEQLLGPALPVRRRQEERPRPRAQRLVLRRAHRDQAAQHRHQQGQVVSAEAPESPAAAARSCARPPETSLRRRPSALRLGRPLRLALTPAELLASAPPPSIRYLHTTMRYVKPGTGHCPAFSVVLRLRICGSLSVRGRELEPWRGCST